MAKWHTITDSFPGSALNGTLWPTVVGTPTVSGGRLGLGTTTPATAAQSTANDLTDSYVSLRMEPDPTNTVLQLGFDLGPDFTGANKLSMWKTGTLLHMGSTVSSVLSDSTLTYDPSAHAFWRIRQATSTNQVFFETSPDGATWTTRRTITTPFTVTAVKLQIYATDNAVVGGGGGGGTFDMTVAGTGTGTTRYLATTGSDSNAGTIGSPWGTLQHACASLGPGDTLLIRGGTYVRADAVTFATNATSSSRILVKNYPGETVIFDGQNGGGNSIVPSASPGAKYWVFDGITFTRYYDDSGNGVISCSGNDNIIIQRCTFIDNGNDSPNPHNDHSVYIADGCTNITVRNCHMQGQHGAGVHAYSSGGGSSSNIQVINCTMFDCYWGVLGGDQNNNLTIAQNTFYLIQSEAISFGWGPGSVGVSGLKVYNNVVVAGSAICLGASGSPTTHLTEDYNDFFATGNPIQWNGSAISLASYKTTSGQGAHTIGTNPNINTSTYRLNSGSPAINAGIATPSPGPYNYDKDEKVRPIGAALDMGAFEFG